MGPKMEPKIDESFGRIKSNNSFKNGFAIGRRTAKKVFCHLSSATPQVDPW